MIATIAVTISGIVYGCLKYFGDSLARVFPFLSVTSDDPFSIVHHPLQPWSLHLHVLAAPFLVFGVGWIFKEHILAKLSSRAAPVRRSGVVALALLAPMIVSGYALQVITHEILHLGTVVVHIAAGLLYAGVYLLHVWLAPKRNGRST